MSAHSHWTPGDHIVLRGVWRQRLWFACPVTVVQDTPALIALYWRAGTWTKVPGRRFTPQDMLSTEQLDLVDKTWVKTDVLMLVTPGAAHSVYAMWEQGHTRFRCWYVNLQEPLRRTSLGFDTMDHLLDVVVSHDRSEWRWKDEDELASAGADTYPCAPNYPALPAKSSVIQARLASGGGWARLTLAVRRNSPITQLKGVEQ